MNGKRCLLLVGTLFFVLLGPEGVKAGAGPAPATVSSLTVEAIVESVASDQASLAVVSGGKLLQISVKTPELKPRLKDRQRGDILILELTDDKGEKALKGVSVKAIPVSRELRIVVLLMMTLAVVAFLRIFFTTDPRKFLVGEDGRYSNSKFQSALWFGVLLVTYLATLWLRWRVGGGEFIGHVGIPDNLLLLSGISALTLVAAKGVTTKKVEDAKREAEEAARKPGGTIAGLLQAAAPSAEITAAIETIQTEAAQKAKPGIQPAQRRFFSDLVSDDRGRPDIGDIQMVIFTLLAVGVYVALTFKFLGSIELLKTVSLPDVDSTILATFGLGKGAYIGKKIVS